MRKINSLEDLRAAKRELARKKEATRKEFTQHLVTLRRDATGYFIQKIVLPLGIGALATFTIKHFFVDRKNKEQEDLSEQSKESLKEEVKDEVNKESWLNYFNIILSIIKIIQTAMMQQEVVEEEGTLRESPSEEGGVSEKTSLDNSKPVNDTQDETIEPISPSAFVRSYHSRRTTE